MKKTTAVFTAILISILFINCKSDKKKLDFTTITKHYFDDKNALDPLSATQNGQNEYNDELQFEMTDSYRKSQLSFFNTYESTLDSIDEKDLSVEEKNSYQIIKWEEALGKKRYHQPTNLLPINNFWETNLTLGKNPVGTGGQQFKPEKDYTIFLKRLVLNGVGFT